MTHLVRCGVAACILLLPVGALAQSSSPSAPDGKPPTNQTSTDEQHSINPQGATGDEGITNSGGPGAGEGKRRANTMPSGVPAPSRKPPLQLSEDERAATREAISLEHSYQRTPDKFTPQIGASVTSAVKLMPLPRPLVYDVPVLQQYAYAKLDRNVVLVDPMSMQVVDVIARKFPASGEKSTTPLQWAATRGRQLLGLLPESDASAATSATTIR
jgi:hypothetical protein